MRGILNILRKKIIDIALLALILSLFSAVSARAQQKIDIVGPDGSGSFGSKVYALPNGNIVVTDPSYDIPQGASNVGAVHLYNGATAALISTMTGSAANDQIGFFGVTVLTNGNYVVSSLGWDNNGLADVGAVTLCSGATGCPATISPANSLVGSSSFDSVGIVTGLPNGNYVVTSPEWDNEAVVQNVGAATLCNGTTGCVGAVSASNSLVGTDAFDNVGNIGIVVLTNGNYLVRSSNWNNGAATRAGAVTFCDAATGTTGAVSAANSLVGSTADDQIGTGTETVGVKPLTNGNYVVLSPYWDKGAFVDTGAATFGNGTTGVSGVINSSNSLVGTDQNDRVGLWGATALTTGNYVVCSPRWGPIDPQFGSSDYGAATFGNGTTGISGMISVANSLIGVIGLDNVCSGGVTALPNGNYVVLSPIWCGDVGCDSGAVTYVNVATGTTGRVTRLNSFIGDGVERLGNAGITVLANGNFVVRTMRDGLFRGVPAVTWCSGTTGCPIEKVSIENSLGGDNIGSGGIIPLPNGNYVIVSPDYDNAAVRDVGAITLCDGSSPITGRLSPLNSIVGSTADDLLGSGGVKVLATGNYVVASPLWDNNGVGNAGAVTFRSATDFSKPQISPANSLVGTSTNDFVGGGLEEGGVTPLANGNYVVSSPTWNNGGLLRAGAVTLGNGTTGISGPVTVFNSLAGTWHNDFVGKVTALPNSDYVVLSKNWDFVTIEDAGAVTRSSGTNGTVGFINFHNSVTGSRPLGGRFMNFVFDSANNQIVVGRPMENIVTLSRSLEPTAADVSISGKVTNGKSGVPRATVTLTDSHGNIHTVTTSSFGYFKFEDIQAGQTLVIHPAAKGLVFSPQIITAMEDITDLIFTAQ